MRSLFLTFLLFTTAARSDATALAKGTVLDAHSKQPIVPALVICTPSGQSTTTDARGEFSLACDDSNAPSLTVSSPGYATWFQNLDLTQQGPLVILLDPLASYSDRIEVTASRAKEGKDAATFSNIPGDKIAATYWGQDPALALSELTPSMFAYSDSGNGIGYSYFTIRGFGQSRSRVTLNGAPLNDAESGELFFIDLADFLSTASDVQLRRGVFGLSGIGGAIDINTAAGLNMERSFSLQIGAGSYRTQRETMRFESGLLDGKWSLTARYSKMQTDGYRDQSWVDMWNYFISIARLGEHSRLRIVLFGGPEQTHLAYEGVSKSVLDGGLTGNADRDRRTNPISFPGEVDNFNQPHYQIIHEVSFGPNTDFTQTLFAFRGDGYYSQFRADRKLVEYNLPDVTLPDRTVVKRTDLIRQRKVGEWDYGWVPSLSHRFGNWTFSVNGEARFHRAHHTGEVTWAQYYPTGIAPDHRYYDYGVRKRSLTISANAQWEPNSKITLTAGLQHARHTYELFEDRIKLIAFKEKYTFSLPRLGAVIHLHTDTDIYFSAAQGMREPNFRNLYDPQDFYGTRIALKPEEVWDYEAGVSLRRSLWRVRANLFYMSFSNEIVYAGALDDNGVPIYGNGARSRHRGIEVEASWQPFSKLGLDASLTASRNTFTRYREFGWNNTTTSYNGNRIAGYPDLIASLALHYQIGKVDLRLFARHVGRFFVDNSEDNRRDSAARQVTGYVHRINRAYSIVDAGAKIPLPVSFIRLLSVDKLVLEGRINNVLDAKYTAFGYMDVEPLFIPASGRNVYIGLNITL